MLPKKLIDTLKKQKYRIVGNHSGVQVCNWTKNSLTDKGVCYKEKFYGIKSHRCCEMSPSVGFCQNRCIHCWRAIELTVDKEIKGEVDKPSLIIEGCVQERNNLMLGFKGNSKVDMKKYKESQEPTHFAISLTGEPMLYPLIGELVKELRKEKKTTFIVTNGLCPEEIKKMAVNKNLPTQLYVSLNTPNKEMFLKWHRSKEENPWEKFNKTLEILHNLKTRRVLRMTLVKDLNMEKEHVHEYSELIKKAMPDFIEVKGFMSVGYARKRLGYTRMPSFEEIKEYARELASALSDEGYKILDEHVQSRIVLIGKDKGKMKIIPKEI